MKPEKSDIRIILISMIITLTGVVIYHFMFPPRNIMIFQDGQQGVNVAYHGQVSQNQMPPTGFSSVAKKYMPAVVYIRSIKRDEGEESEYNTGSGVVITPAGYIVTNRHVIEGADKILVTDSRNILYEAQKVGDDFDADIALLKIETENHPFAFLGDSEKARVGDWIIQIGNPFKLRNSVSAGIISAKNRVLNLRGASGIEDYIQTDAVANPGNSGGALLDIDGKMIGLISAITTNSGTYEGFSFAIPSNIVKKAVNDIMRYGAVQKPKIGLLVIDDTEGGVKVERVEAYSPGYQKGIHKGDKIIKINGKDIENAAHFQALVFQQYPGDTVVLETVRKGAPHKITLVLKNHLNTVEKIVNRRDPVFYKWGLELRDLTKKEREEYSTPGVYVVSVKAGSKASDIYIEPGYIIRSVNSKKVAGVDDLLRIFKESQDKIVLEGFYKAYPGIYRYVLSGE